MKGEPDDNKSKVLFPLMFKQIHWSETSIIAPKFNFDISHEDIHMSIEKRLFEIIGDDAGFVHTARSRNDQVITDFKIWLRNSTNEIIKLLNSTNKIIIKNAEKNIDVIMPGFTHLKNAQPISFAHYLLAYIEMFKRDKKRFSNNIDYIDECPLGVGALSGTSYKIDRYFTSKKLGFRKPTNNSIDTVSDRDFALDFLASSSICAVHISRLAEELIIWNSDIFKLIKFLCSYCNVSKRIFRTVDIHRVQNVLSNVSSAFRNKFA